MAKRREKLAPKDPAPIAPKTRSRSNAQSRDEIGQTGPKTRSAKVKDASARTAEKTKTVRKKAPNAGLTSPARDSLAAKTRAWTKAQPKQQSDESDNNRSNSDSDTDGTSGAESDHADDPPQSVYFLHLICCCPGTRLHVVQGTVFPLRLRVRGYAVPSLDFASCWSFDTYSLRIT